MMLPLALCAAVLTQDPVATPVPATSGRSQAVPSEASTTQSGRRDQVVLVGGEVLEGRIVLERGSYLEIEIGKGAVVGFRLAQVAEIRRGAGSEAPLTHAAIAPRDEWFTLHDGTGRSVGTLHATVAASGVDGARLVEEWEFEHDGRTFQITSMEEVGSDLAPRTCYYRERVLQDASTGSPLDPMARSLFVRGERIVEATVEGSELVVDRIAPEGRTQRRVPFASPASFPLLAREHQRTAVRGPVELAVFDPAVEDLRTMRYEVPRVRRVAFEDAAVAVDELVVGGADGQNATWWEPVRGTLRREVAGPALVAVRVEQGSARDLVSTRTMPSPFVAEPLRRFGLWLPNPVWKAETPRNGAVALVAPAHDASITLSQLEGLDAMTSLDAAAQAVERWSKLQDPPLAVARRQSCTVRGEAALRLEFEGGKVGAGRRAVAVVVAWAEGFVVLRCAAPSASWDELQADFVAAAARVELGSAAVAALDATPAEPVREGDAAAVPQVEPPVEAPSPAPSMPRSQKGKVRVPMQIGASR